MVLDLPTTALVLQQTPRSYLSAPAKSVLLGWEKKVFNVLCFLTVYAKYLEGGALCTSRGVFFPERMKVWPGLKPSSVSKPLKPP